LRISGFSANVKRLNKRIIIIIIIIIINLLIPLLDSAIISMNRESMLSEKWMDQAQVGVQWRT
jgi:hypothetical protein